MAGSKIKAKKGRKPVGNLENVKVAKGLKKAPASKGEVSGRISPGAWYICACCGASNWVPYGWSYFYCWNDRCLNYC
jgi:hypothetical protein